MGFRWPLAEHGHLVWCVNLTEGLSNWKFGDADICKDAQETPSWDSEMEPRGSSPWISQWDIWEIEENRQRHLHVRLLEKPRHPPTSEIGRSPSYEHSCGNRGKPTAEIWRCGAHKNRLGTPPSTG